MNPIILHAHTTVTSLTTTTTTILLLLISSATITPLPVVQPFQLSQSSIKRITTTTTHSRNDDAGYHYHRNTAFGKFNTQSSSSLHHIKRSALSLNNNYGSTDSSSTTAAADFSKMTSINDQPINCPHFGTCPGCSTKSSTTSIPTATSASRYFSSNSITSHTLSSSSSSSSSSSQSYATILPTPSTSYRTTAKLVATPRTSTWARDGCLFGLYARGTHNVIPIPSCPVHHPSINRAVELLERATTKARTSCFDEESGEGDLRYVQCQVERGSGKVVLTLVYNKESWKECQPGLSRLVKELKRLEREENGDGGGLSWHSIWCHLNAGLGNNIFARGENKWLRLEGPEYFREVLPLVEGVDEKQGLLHYVPMGFRQGNVQGFDVIAKYVAEKVPRGSKVCELYAGVGVLGLTALSVGYWRDVIEGVGEGETRGLRWIRCSDENPVNPRCFDRSVNTMPTEITGRQRRSFNKGGNNNKKDKRNKQRYTNNRNDNRRRGTNNSMKDPDMTLEDLLSGKVTIDDTPPEAKITYMVASASKALYEGQAMGANCLIVDPPRKGLDPDVITSLCKPHNPSQPSVDDIDFLITKHRHMINLCNDVTTLIYVSCGFDALARDCDKLLMSEGAGWSIESAKGFVLFPGSDHVETVVVFKRMLGRKR